ncbi:hypothetical protein FHR83_005808 [Actinoplanes campanulatus]|uniref:CHAT domain-containing protein n=1 Tax=Actinoplanes campanulatus TaxID=113559 RepID=A0A7W5FGZ0_9ACTN|nr:CHAT domain-containing protein [Actinoplanes campanulatus]MBB3098123.1 hypothetical protein [Actinoplanes campanulatus]GGN32508.1 hypothetical protein GCM10010109_53600 [Actinoplanes campanulatus]GID40005.1 hypothetical protein Aca09nite_65110 [Actinoplanes campanulatus]
MPENDANTALAALRDWWQRVTDGETVSGPELDAVISRGRPALAVDTGGEAHRLLAIALHERWNRARTSFDDAGRAIGLWQHVLDRTPEDPVAAFFCGTLVTFLAERTRDRADIARAVHLADIATRTLDNDAAWHLSGRAHLVRAFSGGQQDGLAVALDRFAEALRRDPGDQLRCEIAREQLRAAFARYGRDELDRDEFHGYVDLGYAVLDAPGDATLGDQALLAGTLAMVEIGIAVPEGRAHDFSRVRALLARYRDVDLPDPHLRAELAAAQAILDNIAGTTGDLDRGVGPLTRLARSDRFPERNRAVIADALAILRGNRAVQEGDLAAFESALTAFENASDPTLNGFAAVLSARREALRLIEEGDELEAAAVMYAAREALPTGDPAFDLLRDLLGGAVTGDGTGAPFTAAARSVTLTTAVRAAARSDDTAALGRLAAEAGELLGHIPDDYPMLKIPAYQAAGAAEEEVARRDPARGAAARAAAHYAAARTLAGGPHHPLWPQLTVAHGRSLRLGGHPDRAGSRALGRSALVALTWQALIQADTGHALEWAATADRHVRTVAAWCAEDAAADDLVAVLDAGRGLALHAATASRSMPERLIAAGHPDLATAWRETSGAGDSPDDNLRVRAMHALTADSDVLATPDPAGIRQSLTAVGADALVYLVAADDDRTGLAVIVPATGPVHVLPLPDLAAGRAVGGWIESGRDLVPEDDDGQDSFDDVCRWAWTACMGPLTAFTDRWRLDRPARLVLIPTGALTLVPWHAARYDDGTGRHHAIERLVVSYSVSARMFRDTAGMPLRSPESALIVGDPRGDLRYAAEEARDVHRDFHPGGTLLGRATRDDVLDWIAKPGRGPSLLHLACHGHVDQDRPAEASLALADGDLPVLELLARARSAGLDLDRVVLSACSTGAVGSLHDEAVSLATAFLAGGAHTVFGSLWPVPDEGTARLMYAMHRHLSVDGHAPVDALRLAQLAVLGDLDEDDDDHGWAAFVHLGR